MKWAGHVARMGRREACTGFGGEPEGKRPQERPRRRWDLQEVGCGVWTGLRWLRRGTVDGHL